MNQIKDQIITFLPWEDIEPEAQQQVINTSEVPIIFKHVAVMPDCHFGKGATVGTVIATKGGVIPAAVGVDIGCGMIAVTTSIEASKLTDLASIRSGLERRIPMSAGRFNHKITPSAQTRIDTLTQLAGDRLEFYDEISANWRDQLGTLGGGNHFIELCLDETNTVWATLHSGSRGIGNKIGMYHIKVAQQEMKKRGVELADIDLAYLTEGTKEFDLYIKDLHFAQEFARHSRDEMMDRFIEELRQATGIDEIEIERINSHHNFTQIENHFGEDVWVTRKGAVEAKLGQLMMIPGSMGTSSYIVSGLANPLSFNSSPHGAGRRMSRTKARAAFNMQDLEKAMEGIEFRKSDVLIDEIPGAYKDIDEVIKNASELIKVEHTLKQILNCKGD